LSPDPVHDFPPGLELLAADTGASLAYTAALGWHLIASASVLAITAAEQDPPPQKRGRRSAYGRSAAPSPLQGRDRVTTDAPACDYAGCPRPAITSAGGWNFCRDHAAADRHERVEDAVPSASARTSAPSPRTGDTHSAARIAAAALQLRRGLDETDVAHHLNLTVRELQVARARAAEEETLATKACDHITDLPVRVLGDNPINVRSDLGDPQEMAELEQSILEHGVLQPLLVMRRDGQYVLLAGHRRLAAARAAGLNRVPITFAATMSETRSIETMLVENLQRADLHPIDEAIAYQQLLDRGRTRSEICSAVGKNAGHVSARLSLLNLTPREQASVRRGELTLTDAYRAGRDRSARRRAWDTKRPKPRRVPHFTAQHPQAHAAAAACLQAGHEVTLKLGPACGPCWEQAIRDDVVAVVRHAADLPRQEVAAS
jgi:ParB family chromosome partitioning protein